MLQPDKRRVRVSNWLPESLRLPVEESVKAADLHLEKSSTSFGQDLAHTVLSGVSQSDILIVDVSESNPLVGFEIGAARALGCAVVTLVRRDTKFPQLLGSTVPLLFYEHGREDKSELIQLLTHLLKHLPKQRGIHAEKQLPLDLQKTLERLPQQQFENLFRELLLNTGFDFADWTYEHDFKSPLGFDLIAFLKKSDPEGSALVEPWFVYLKVHDNVQPMHTMVDYPRRILLKNLTKHVAREISPHYRDAIAIASPVILFVSRSPELSRFLLAKINELHHMREPESEASVRFKVWDVPVVIGLLKQFPHLINKYVAEGDGSVRKSLDDLYKENAEILAKYEALIGELRAEQNARAEAEKGAAWKAISLAAAHKIGNPLFAIETNILSLRNRVKDSSDPEVRVILDEIAHSIDRAKDIVAQFKSLTTMDSLSLGAVSLDRLLYRSCETARRHGVKCKISSKRPIEIAADEAKLEECFQELIDNSLAWMSPGKGEITIGITHEAANERIQNGSVRIIYEDNGPGIASSMKEKVFDPFFTTRSSGTGLGLAIVRRAIESHGGTISEIGKVGSGVRFEIMLPTDLNAKKVASRRRRARRVLKALRGRGRAR